MGRDHASPGSDSAGKPFHGPYDAQELAERLRPEHGVGVLPFGEMMYLLDEDRDEEVSRIPQEARTALERGRQATVLDGDARRGEITGFTGIDDPYEAPEHPELTLDTVVTTPEDNARRVLAHLERAGFVR